MNKIIVAILPSNSYINDTDEDKDNTEDMKRWNGSACAACGREECFGACPEYPQYERSVLFYERLRTTEWVV